MNQKIAYILRDVLESINPPKEDVDFIKKNLNEFLEKFKERIEKSKIKAQVFVGGSFAKKTLIKKDHYDIDVFVRFDKEYKDEEISELLSKLLSTTKDVVKIHGSRDYFRIKIRGDFFIELIPVTNVSNPKDARNITDLSYSHVKYINKNVKSQELLDDIRLAKAFCHATGTYGAESYINGFSGYGLELLVYHYGGFLDFIKAVSKMKLKQKNIIDVEGHYKNKNLVLMDMNASKLNSPIILIDPTFKQRNALAALSDETLKRFQTSCKKFLNNPSIKSFETKTVDLEKIKAKAESKGFEYIQLTAKTGKQIGDVAGSKLLKFFKHFGTEMSRYFEIKKNGFAYNGKQAALYYFVAKSKGEIISPGPFENDKASVSRFRKMHKKILRKDKKLYAIDKVKFNSKDFTKQWIKNNKKRLKEMSISSLDIFD